MNVKFAIALKDLLQGTRRGHMGCFHYSSPVEANDPVRGAELWSKLIENPTTYSLFDQEAKLLANYSWDIASTTGRIARFVDLGPGSLRAVQDKTLPLLNWINPKHYTAYDYCRSFADEAAKLVAQKFPDARTMGYVGDFMEDELLEASGEMRFIAGGSFFNLSGDDGKQPYMRLALQLRQLVAGCDYFLVTAHTSQEKKGLIETYNDPAHIAFSENFAYTLARDSGAIGLQAEFFQYEPVWHEDRSLLAHTLIATQTQHIELLGKPYTIERGASLHVDNSYKLTADDFAFVCDLAGVELIESFGEGQMKTFLVRNPQQIQRVAA